VVASKAPKGLIMSNKFWGKIEKSFLVSYRTTFILWISTALFVGIVKHLISGLHNNYQIYKSVFFHLADRVSLYPPPTPAMDSNYYGPIFSLIIAPFAVLPDYIGATLWLSAIVALLFFAIKQLPLERWQHAVIYWFCLNSLFVSVVNVQFNVVIAAVLILAYTFLRKEKDVWAALVIMIGAFVKLYGIVGLAFFFFSRHKPKFILWLFVWAGLLFVLPMLFSSPQYIIDQYANWFHALVSKNQRNIDSVMLDISVFGMFRRIFAHPEWSNLPFLLAGMLTFAATYLRIDKYRQSGYQLLMLASALMFTVLFSTGSEQNTYLIAVVGVAVWFVVQPRPLKLWQELLFAFVFVFTVLTPSDLFPRWLYVHFMRPYSLMALPCLVTWLVVVCEMIATRETKSYSDRERV
jgi:hypothetical protein